MKYCLWPKNDVKKPVTICNDVWIGSNAIILQGVTVGNGAIIAAGALVSRSIPAYSIFGGVPAKQIGQHFDGETLDKISSSDWWDHDIEWIEDFVEKLYEGNGKPQ